MVGPGGKEVGRVSIRAVPESTRFRADLKKMLERVERTVNVTLPVTADTSTADSQIQRFQRNWNGKEVNLGVGVGTAAAKAQLSVLTRPRIAPVIVKVSKASLAKAGALLAAFSGARVAGDLVQNLTDRISNLDRALPKIAVVSTGIASVASLVLNSLSGVLSFGAGFGQLFGILAAGPGILAGMAVGGGALALALADTKTELGVLVPGFQRLQDKVSTNFWAQARKPIIDFVRRTLPELTTGLAATGGAIGSWAAQTVSGISAAFGGGRITSMFAPLIESIQIASTGTGGFAQAIAVLGQVGGSFLPRLAQWAADLSNQFGAFLLQTEASGHLQLFIENGITAAHQLFDILGSIGSIIGGIADAASAAGGGGGFAPLAAGLAAIAAVVTSPEFQTALTTIFTGASIGASGLAAALGPIGSMLSTLAPILSSILGSTGLVLGQILGQIATALARPEFAAGLAGFFAGIQTGLTAIGPSLPALADAFGTLLAFAGQLAAQLGPVLGTVLSSLAPILITILKALEPILPILGAALISIISTLAPVVLQLVQALLPLVQMIGDQLQPIIGPLLDSLMSLLVPLIQLVSLIVSAVMPALGPLLPLIAQLVSAGFGPLGDILTTLMPLFQILAAVAGASMTVLGGIIRTVTDLITGNFDDIGKTWQDVWTGIQDFAKKSFNAVSDTLGGFINGAIDLINGLSGGLNQVLSGISIATGGVINLQVGKIPHVLLPHLATGADILARPGGTAFIGGDGGQAETVTNRGKTNRLIEFANALAARALAVTGAGSGHTFDIKTDDPVAAAMEALRLMREAEAA